MIKYLLENSKVISLLGITREKCCYLNTWIDNLCKDSYTCGLISRVCEKIKVYLKYSFLGKVTALKEEERSF